MPDKKDRSYNRDRLKARQKLDKNVKESKAWNIISSIGEGVKSVIGSGKQIRNRLKNSPVGNQLTQTKQEMAIISGKKSKTKVHPASGKNNKKGNKPKLKF
jgi:hypothetical protein